MAASAERTEGLVPSRRANRLDAAMRRIGEEARKGYQRRAESGFFDRYLSGEHILDIGYRGGDPLAVPIVEGAIGVELDYPGYDGVHLPFRDASQDAVFVSHCLEHVHDYRACLADWYRVLKIGGYLLLIVPHKYLYERRPMPPSIMNPDHKRFYTPASLLAEIEESLPVNGYRLRHLVDNDEGFDYTLGADHHARGCYEIEAILQRIDRPAYSDHLELPPQQREALSRFDRYFTALVLQRIGRDDDGRAPPFEGLNYLPPFETLQRMLRDRARAGSTLVGYSTAEIAAALRPILPHVAVDEAWYFRAYPDVAAAAQAGAIESGRAHFIAHGYFESRLPRDYFAPDAAPVTMPPDLS